MLPSGFRIIYTLGILTYIWFRFIPVLASRKINYPVLGKSFSVVIPFYNENMTLLRKCLNSVIDARGEKQIIVVNDGSDNGIDYKSFLKGLDIEYIEFSKNLGKRHGLFEGFIKAEHDYVVTLDSDTIVDKEAFIEILKPFYNSKVGISTGNVKVINKTTNRLTKAISARYSFAFGVERKSMSLFGVVDCASGVLSAYKKSIFHEIKGDFMKQVFLGEKCTYGDDRALTNFILKIGYDVVYVDEAICYTYVPETVWKYIKQQIRWKKSYIRESYLTLKFAFGRSKFLFFNTLYGIFLNALSLFVRISFIILIISDIRYIFLYIFAVVIMASLRGFYLYINKLDSWRYSVLYGFFYEICIYWLLFVSLLSLKDTRWGTR